MLIGFPARMRSGLAGFTPSMTVKGVFGDPKARVIELKRRQKKLSVLCAVMRLLVFTTASDAVFVISPAATRGCIWKSNCAVSSVGDARK